MTKKELATLKKALKLPGMESHLRRKKAAWKDQHPSKEVLYRWVQHRIAQEIYSQLMSTPLSDLLSIKRGRNKYAIKEK